MSNLICPYCRTEAILGESNLSICNGCATPHHADCYEENGGCTIFGCSEAPAEEAPLKILAPELATLGGEAASTVPPPVASTPPPPHADGTPAWKKASVSVNVYVPMDYREEAKSRVTFVLLGIIFGCFGVHNFYAGFVRKGVFQLCLTFFSCFYLALVSWVWAIFEICMINKDAEGVAFS
jgi:TM2 domain-containing membrane protein YozV